MKTKLRSRPNNLTQIWRGLFRSSTSAHERWLIFHLQTFNFDDRWNQLLSRNRTERFGA